MNRSCFAALYVVLISGFCGLPFKAWGAEPATNDKVVGQWRNEDATFEIYAEGGKLNARIVALRAPLTPDGRIKTDIHNPDASKHDRPVIGMVFMSGFTPTVPSKWENGTIYDPKSGHTYSCFMELQGPDKLKVRGYMLVSMIGRTEIWTRARSDGN